MCCRLLTHRCRFSGQESKKYNKMHNFPFQMSILGDGECYCQRKEDSSFSENITFLQIAKWRKSKPIRLFWTCEGKKTGCYSASSFFNCKRLLEKKGLAVSVGEGWPLAKELQKRRTDGGIWRRFSVHSDVCPSWHRPRVQISCNHNCSESLLAHWNSLVM